MDGTFDELRLAAVGEAVKPVFAALHELFDRLVVKRGGVTVHGGEHVGRDALDLFIGVGNTVGGAGCGAVERRDEAVSLRHRDEARCLLHVLHIAHADLADNVDALRGKLREVGIGHAVLEHHRSGVDLGEGGVVVIPVVLGIDGLRLGGDDVPGGTGEVMPAEADKTRDAGAGVVVYPVISLIGFKIVRKRRVGVRIDDARAERKAVRVDVERVVERGRVGAIADKDDLIAVGADGIPGQNGAFKSTGQNRSDVVDQSFAHIRQYLSFLLRAGRRHAWRAPC